MTRLRPGRPGLIYRQGQWWHYFYSPPCRYRLWVPPSLIPSVYRGLLPQGVKRPGREVHHSPPASAEVNKAWRYTSTSQYVFMAWCLDRYMDNFTFTYAYLLTPWSRVVLERLTFAELFKKFTRLRHWTLSWDRWIKSTLSHIYSQYKYLLL